jgi:glucosylceramidase
MQNVVIGSTNNWSKTVLEWNAANNSGLGPRTPGGCNTCLGAITVNNSTSYTKNVAYYIIGQISKFVKPGALRISSSSSSGSIFSAGFKNPDGSIALVVYNSGSANTIKIVSGSAAFNYSVPASSAVTFNWSTGTPPVTGLPGYYNIISRNSNKGLDVADNATTSGSRIQQYDITNGGGNNQRWKFVSDGSGNYYIIVKSTGMYLAPENNGTADGLKVQQKTFSASNEFKWTVTSLGGGYYKIINVNSGKSLDVENVSTANGANIQVWTYTGGLNQQWQLVQVESTAKKALVITENESPNDMAIFINSTNDYLKIDTNHEGNAEVEVFSITGQSVLKKTVSFVKGSQSEIEISKLSKGVYVVRVNDSKGSYSKKVLKQ